MGITGGTSAARHANEGPLIIDLQGGDDPMDSLPDQAATSLVLELVRNASRDLAAYLSRGPTRTLLDRRPYAVSTPR
jgi:hypothetical protein